MAAGALYPGTFDPFTNGHEGIVRRAVRLFGRVVIAVAASPAKAPTFSLDERLELISSVVGTVPGVEVRGYEGLTVEVARELGLAMVIRGLRAAADFEYEFQLASMNKHLEQDIETVFLTPSEADMFISSTLVREIAALGGDVAPFVSPTVDAALRARLRAS
jgi:pantetheine-phosphate adenylyltransferase